VLWNLLAGYAGLVSVGQQGFVGIGGYALFGLTMLLGIHPLAALVLAGVIAGAVAVPTALLLFRLRGAYLAIGTWVMAEIFRLGLAQYYALGGGSGASLSLSVVRQIGTSRDGRETLMYLLALLLTVGTLALVYFLLRSRQGLALTAIRDSETASASLGVGNARVKLGVYVTTAFVTGVIGALIFLVKLRISPDAAFSVIDWTANIIFIVVIGGIGTIEGPIVGTIVFFALRSALANYGTWYMIAFGVIAIAVMLKAPRGLWGFVSQRYDLHFFPVQRRLRLKGEAMAPSGGASGDGA
jgi:branched-chain amino acid transport system permease protein